MTEMNYFFNSNDKSIRNDDDYIIYIFRNVGHIF
jgi:hypothetical protein